jgi:hypothetical protein
MRNLDRIRELLGRTFAAFDPTGLGEFDPLSQSFMVGTVTRGNAIVAFVCSRELAGDLLPAEPPDYLEQCVGPRVAEAQQLLGSGGGRVGITHRPELWS